MQEITGKKILFVLSSLKLGGMERVLVTVANQLAELGYDVTVMIFKPVFDIKNELSDKVRFIYKPPKKHLGNKIPYIRRTMYDEGLWEARASARQLYSYYVGKENYDIEVAFFRGRSVKIISGSTNPDSKKYAWVHSDFTKCKSITSSFKDMDEAKRAYSVFDKIICVSKQAEKAFQEVIGIKDKTVTVYNPIPVEEIRKKSLLPCDFNKTRFTIMSVGHLFPVKGYDRLIKVCAELEKQGCDFELVIIGYGKERENLEKLAKEVGIKRLTLAGKQDNPYAYVRSADLYVCSSRYEGFNLTVAEALALGVPVLSTDCAGPNEILDNGKYGMIVENSEDGLYNGLLSLLNDKALLEDYKKKSESRGEFFDLANCEKRLLGIF